MCCENELAVNERSHEPVFREHAIQILTRMGWWKSEYDFSQQENQIRYSAEIPIKLSNPPGSSWILAKVVFRHDPRLWEAYNPEQDRGL